MTMSPLVRCLSARPNSVNADSTCRQGGRVAERLPTLRHEIDGEHREIARALHQRIEDVEALGADLAVKRFVIFCQKPAQLRVRERGGPETGARIRRSMNSPMRRNLTVRRPT
jgi:hypothetical protein